MSPVKHTIGPWIYDAPENMVLDDNCKLVAQPRSTELGIEARNANGFLIAAAPELLAALEAYRSAEAMPVYGDSSDFVGGNVTMRKPGNSAWGYICDKHGLGYQGGCICCHDEHQAYADRKDRDARYARDEALRAAAKLAKSAIAKATGESA